MNNYIFLKSLFSPSELLFFSTKPEDSDVTIFLQSCRFSRTCELLNFSSKIMKQIIKYLLSGVVNSLDRNTPDEITNRSLF